MKKILFSLALGVMFFPGVSDAQYKQPTDANLTQQAGQQVNTGLSTATSGNEIVLRAVLFVLQILGTLAILMIVIAGIMYISSGGNESRIETAKKMLVWAIGGLVIALFAWAIVYAISISLGAGVRGGGVTGGGGGSSNQGSGGCVEEVPGDCGANDNVNTPPPQQLPDITDDDPDLECSGELGTC